MMNRSEKIKCIQELANKEFLEIPVDISKLNETEKRIFAEIDIKLKDVKRKSCRVPDLSILTNEEQKQMAAISRKLRP